MSTQPETPIYSATHGARGATSSPTYRADVPTKIPYRVDVVSDLVLELDVALSQLTTRLEPILTRTGTDAEKRGLAPVTAGSPIADRLDDIAEQFRARLEHLRDITDRLDV